MQSLSRILTATRAPTLLVLVVGLLLLLPPQFADILSGFHDDPPAGIMFQVALGLLAFLTWFWSRAALNASLSLTDAQALVLLNTTAGRWWLWWPRILFGCTGLIGCALALRSAAWGQALLSSAWTAAGLWLLTARRTRRGGPQPALPPLDAPWGRIADGAPMRLGWMARGLVILGVTAFIAAGTDTFFLPEREKWQLSVWIARAFPGPAAALACFSLMLGPLTAMTVWSHRTRITLPLRGQRRKVPVPWLVVAIGLAIASSSMPLHGVRLAALDPEPMIPQQRATLAEALRSWIDHCTNGIGKIRPVVVALSGGASRAGLWSSRVLRAIDRLAPDNGGIFAISSVSGGSLGAADYVVERAASGGRSCHLRTTKPDAVMVEDDGLVAHYSADLLGPLLAGMILDDSARALLAAPLWPILKATGNWPPRGGDRAGALERAFERAWRMRSPPYTAWEHGDLGSDFLGEFHDRDGRWRGGMPIWISNGTDVHGGERLITIPIQPAHRASGDGLDLQRSWPFEGAKDVLALLGSDVRMSTAVLNSARFPFLSPSGELVPRKAESRPARDGYLAGAPDIVDGGYFENSGVTTGFELVQWLRVYSPYILHEPHPGPPALDIDPILVAVDADAEATVTGDDVPRCGSGPSRDPETYGRAAPASQLLAPLAALYDTRSGHGDYAIQKAREALCNRLSTNVAVLDGDMRPDAAPLRPAFFHFYLHASPGDPIPLNWALSQKTEHLIWTDLTSSADNRIEFDALARALKPPAPTPEAHESKSISLVTAKGRE